MACLQILPPAPPRPGLSFDKHQFGGLRKFKYAEGFDRATLGEHGSAHLMVRASFAGQRCVPIFSGNDAMLRQVLVAVVAGTCGTCLSNGDTATREQINRLSASHLRRIGKSREQAALRRAAEQNGGLLQLFARLAYMSWRLGWSSVEIARQTGLRPVGVRVRLYRMVCVARRLGFPTYTPTKKNYKPPIKRARKQFKFVSIEAQLSRHKESPAATRYAALRAEGMCTDCATRKAELGRRLCKPCDDAERKRVEERARRRREAA